MIVMCVDQDRIIVTKLHVTIKYAFYLAVGNVERQIVSSFVKGGGGGCFNPNITKADWNCCLLISWILRNWVT